MWARRGLRTIPRQLRQAAACLPRSRYRRSRGSRTPAPSTPSRLHTGCDRGTDGARGTHVSGNRRWCVGEREGGRERVREIQSPIRSLGGCECRQAGHVLICAAGDAMVTRAPGHGKVDAPEGQQYLPTTRVPPTEERERGPHIADQNAPPPPRFYMNRRCSYVLSAIHRGNQVGPYEAVDPANPCRST